MQIDGTDPFAPSTSLVPEIEIRPKLKYLRKSGKENRGHEGQVSKSSRFVSKEYVEGLPIDLYVPVTGPDYIPKQIQVPEDEKRHPSLQTIAPETLSELLLDMTALMVVDC